MQLMIIEKYVSFSVNIFLSVNFYILVRKVTIKMLSSKIYHI